MKEKERREGDSIGGVLLSDNDKSLLQRWTMMMDRCNDKTQIPNKERGKNKDCNISLQCVAKGENTQGLPSSKTEKELRKTPSHQQFISDETDRANEPSVFHPTNTQQAPLIFSMSQPKPPADISVAVSTGMDIIGGTGGFGKNNIFKPHSEGSGQSGFSCLGNWGGQPQQPQPKSKLQPARTSFLQPQLKPQTQSEAQPQLIPLEAFLTKALTQTAIEKNANADVGGQNNLSSQQIPSAASTGPMEKLCPSVEEKSGPRTTIPLTGALGVPSQPQPSLGFTDTGQQGPTMVPDIHTVTLQLSKSQVCLSFICSRKHLRFFVNSALTITIKPHCIISVLL